MEEEALEFIEALGESNSKNDRKSVKEKNVRNSGKKVRPVLKSNETRRFFNIGRAFADAFFDVKKKEEKDTFGETETPASKAEREVIKSEEKKKSPFKFPLLATLAVGITAFATWLADFLGPVGEFITKTLPKLFKPMAKITKGFFTAVKGGKLISTLTSIAGKIGKRLLKFGRFIPVIGSLFSFGFGIARWKKGETIPAIFEFLSGILNLLPTGVGNIASLLIDGGLLLYDLNKAKGKDTTVQPKGGFDMWGKIHDWAMGTPVISNIMSLGKGIGAVFSGKWEEAADHFDKAFPWVGAVINWFVDAGKRTGQWLQDQGLEVGSPGEFFASLVDKVVSVFKDMMEGIYDWLVGAADWVIDGVKDLGGAAWKGIKAVGSFLNPFDDVVLKGDKIIPINKKDDIIAAKEGGILDNVFKTIQRTMDTAGEKINQQKGFLNKVLGGVGSIGESVFKGVGGLAQDFLGVDNIVNEIRTSNAHLGQLVQLTAQLVAGQGQNAAPSQRVLQQPSNDMSGSMQGPSYNDGRFDYTNSAYNIGS